MIDQKALERIFQLMPMTDEHIAMFVFGEDKEGFFSPASIWIPEQKAGDYSVDVPDGAIHRMMNQLRRAPRALAVSLGNQQHPTSLTMCPRTIAYMKNLSETAGQTEVYLITKMPRGNRVQTWWSGGVLSSAPV